jgi:hypothetical protein
MTSYSYSAHDDYYAPQRSSLQKAASKELKPNGPPAGL